jgi:hypothetical protein
LEVDWLNEKVVKGSFCSVEVHEDVNTTVKWGRRLALGGVEVI